MKINTINCIGCGICEAIASDSFRLENGVAIILLNRINDEVKEAIEQCPSNCISE